MKKSEIEFEIKVLARIAEETESLEHLKEKIKELRLFIDKDKS